MSWYYNRHATTNALWLLVIAGLFLSKLYSFLLFHAIVELFSVIIAACIFVLAWNTREHLDNHYLLFIGVAYLFVGILDGVHTLAYKGMGVFPGYDANLPTQLWIAARYLESLSLLMAPLFIRRRLKANLLFFIYFTVSSLLLVLIFGRVFPDCFLPGQGLTPFKVASEYIISILLAISLWLLIRSRGEFDVRVLRLITASIFVTILSEMCFTLYKDVYDALNLTGHFLKTISFYLIYKAIVETGLVSPYDLLYRNLKTSEASLKKTADQLISANRELEQFAFVASHDLRAPLRGIQGFSQALLEDYSPKLDLTGQDYARRILDAAQRMDTLVEKLLAYSRLCRAEIDLKPQSLEQVISEVLSRLAMDIGEKQAQVELAGPWPEVQGHFPTLVQVVANLVANAIKFAAPGQRPQVRLWAEAHDARVRLWVEDKGIGVAPEDQKRIFRIFEALHGEETYPGEGIGLAIVRKGVERLGGQAGVESVPGAGSRFWIELPAPH